MRIPERLPPIFETVDVGLNDGTSALPSLYFDSDKDLGLYRVSANKLGIAASSGVQYNGVLLGPNGSATAPTYSFSSDTDLGLYRYGANQLAIAYAGGAQCLIGNTMSAGTYSSFAGGAGTQMLGGVSDGATAIANKTGNSNSLTNAAAIIENWYSDNMTTLQASLLANGTLKMRNIHIGNGVAAATSIYFNNGYSGYIGQTFVADDLIIGSVAGDLIARSHTGKSILMSIDAGSTVGAALRASNIFEAALFKTMTAPTANSTGTVAIVAKDAGALTNNAGWLPMKTNAGTTVYMPYWT